jgi:anti-anti-sigma factor
MGGQPGSEVGRVGEAVMTTRRQADGVIVVDLRGTLDAATVGALSEALVGALHAEHPVSMIVDLTFVTFVDSMGIGALVTGYNAARETGTRFVVRNPSEFVHRQLWVTGLTELFGLPAMLFGLPATPSSTQTQTR